MDIYKQEIQEKASNMTRNSRMRSIVIKEVETRTKDEKIQQIIDKHQTQETIDEQKAHTNQGNGAHIIEEQIFEGQQTFEEPLVFIEN